MSIPAFDPKIVARRSQTQVDDLSEERQERYRLFNEDPKYVLTEPYQVVGDFLDGLSSEQIRAYLDQALVSDVRYFLLFSRLRWKSVQTTPHNDWKKGDPKDRALWVSAFGKHIPFRNDREEALAFLKNHVKQQSSYKGCSITKPSISVKDPSFQTCWVWNQSIKGWGKSPFTRDKTIIDAFKKNLEEGHRASQKIFLEEKANHPSIESYSDDKKRELYHRNQEVAKAWNRLEEQLPKLHTALLWMIKRRFPGKDPTQLQIPELKIVSSSKRRPLQVEYNLHSLKHGSPYIIRGGEAKTFATLYAEGKVDEVYSADGTSQFFLRDNKTPQMTINYDAIHEEGVLEELYVTGFIEANLCGKNVPKSFAREMSLFLATEVIQTYRAVELKTTVSQPYFVYMGLLAHYWPKETIRAYTGEKVIFPEDIQIDSLLKRAAGDPKILNKIEKFAKQSLWLFILAQQMRIKDLLSPVLQKSLDQLEQNSFHKENSNLNIASYPEGAAYHHFTISPSPVREGETLYFTEGTLSYWNREKNSFYDANQLKPIDLTTLDKKGIVYSYDGLIARSLGHYFCLYLPSTEKQYAPLPGSLLINGSPITDYYINHAGAFFVRLPSVKEDRIEAKFQFQEVEKNLDLESPANHHTEPLFDLEELPFGNADRVALQSIFDLEDPSIFAIKAEAFVFNYFSFTKNTALNDYLLKDPEKFFSRLVKVKKGQCNWANLFLMGLLRAKGIPARRAVGYQAGPTGEATIEVISPAPHIGHTWTEFWNGKRWMVVDGTPKEEKEKNPWDDIIKGLSRQLHSGDMSAEEAATEAVNIALIGGMRSALKELINAICRESDSTKSSSMHWQKQWVANIMTHVRKGNVRAAWLAAILWDNDFARRGVAFYSQEDLSFLLNEMKRHFIRAIETDQIIHTDFIYAIKMISFLSRTPEDVVEYFDWVITVAKLCSQHRLSRRKVIFAVLILTNYRFTSVIHDTQDKWHVEEEHLLPPINAYQNQILDRLNQLIEEGHTVIAYDIMFTLKKSYPNGRQHFLNWRDHAVQERFTKMMLQVTNSKTTANLTRGESLTVLDVLIIKNLYETSPNKEEAAMIALQALHPEFEDIDLQALVLSDSTLSTDWVALLHTFFDDNIFDQIECDIHNQFIWRVSQFGSMASFVLSLKDPFLTEKMWQWVHQWLEGCLMIHGYIGWSMCNQFLPNLSDAHVDKKWISEMKKIINTLVLSFNKMPAEQDQIRPALRVIFNTFKEYVKHDPTVTLSDLTKTLSTKNHLSSAERLYLQWTIAVFEEDERTLAYLFQQVSSLLRKTGLRKGQLLADWLCGFALLPKPLLPDAKRFLEKEIERGGMTEYELNPWPTVLPPDRLAWLLHLKVKKTGKKLLKEYNEIPFLLRFHLKEYATLPKKERFETVNGILDNLPSLQLRGDSEFSLLNTLLDSLDSKQLFQKWREKEKPRKVDNQHYQLSHEENLVKIEKALAQEGNPALGELEQDLISQWVRWTPIAIEHGSKDLKEQFFTALTTHHRSFNENEKRPLLLLFFPTPQLREMLHQYMEGEDQSRAIEVAYILSRREALSEEAHAFITTEAPLPRYLSSMVFALKEKKNFKQAEKEERVQIVRALQKTLLATDPSGTYAPTDVNRLASFLGGKEREELYHESFARFIISPKDNFLDRAFIEHHAPYFGWPPHFKVASQRLIKTLTRFSPATAYALAKNPIYLREGNYQQGVENVIVEKKVTLVPVTLPYQPVSAPHHSFHDVYELTQLTLLAAKEGERRQLWRWYFKETGDSRRTHFPLPKHVRTHIQDQLVVHLKTLEQVDPDWVKEVRNRFKKRFRVVLTGVEKDW